MGAAPAKSRMPAGDRRDQILKVADRLIAELGYLPLPINQLSEAAGVSRALLYARFGDQHEIVNAVLLAHFEVLAASGLMEAIAGSTTLDAHKPAALYLAHIAASGPALHIGFREAYMEGKLSGAVIAYRDRIFRRVARKIRQDLRLGAVDAVAAAQMLLTIPEEAGRLVYEGEVSLEEGLGVCRRLLMSSLDALRPNQAVFSASA